jgi:hypothetical protein
MATAQRSQIGGKARAVASREPTRAFDNQPASLQSDQAKENSRKAGVVHGRRVGGAQRSAQKRQEKRRESR